MLWQRWLRVAVRDLLGCNFLGFNPMFCLVVTFLASNPCFWAFGCLCGLALGAGWSLCFSSLRYSCLLGGLASSVSSWCSSLAISATLVGLVRGCGMGVAWCKRPSARWQLVSVLLCSLCTRGLFLRMPKCIATSYSASAIVVIFLSLGL